MSRLKTVLLLTACLLLSPATRGEVRRVREMPNRLHTFQPGDWSKFPVGSSVTFETESRMGDLRGEMNRSYLTQTTYTITKAENGQRECRVRVVRPENEVVNSSHVFGASPALHIGEDATIIRGRDVVLERAGRTFKCETYRITEREDVKWITTTIWHCPDVPGGVVQQEGSVSIDGSVRATLKTTLEQIEVPNS